MLETMNTTIPSATELRERLLALTYAQLQALCNKTGAPFTTVWKIRAGETENPRLETVRAIWPELPALALCPGFPGATAEAASHE